MRLKPRSIKRKMFTCTQCAQCISACTEVQAAHDAPPLLQWVEHECALQVSDREQGRALPANGRCFRGIPVNTQTSPPGNARHLNQQRNFATDTRTE
jgi:polyferredoxin